MSALGHVVFRWFHLKNEIEGNEKKKQKKKQKKWAAEKKKKLSEKLEK